MPKNTQLPESAVAVGSTRLVGKLLIMSQRVVDDAHRRGFKSGVCYPVHHEHIYDLEDAIQKLRAALPNDQATSELPVSTMRPKCENCTHWDRTPHGNDPTVEWGFCRHWGLVCLPESFRCAGAGFSPKLPGPAGLKSDALIIAFVQGAAWWEHHQTKATMWQSDRNLAEEEARLKLNVGSLGKPFPNAAGKRPR